MFDCMDGNIGEQPIKPEELHRILHGTPGTYTEQELKRIAADYEADLYRLEYRAGELIRHTKLYDAWGIYGNGGEDPNDEERTKA
jgi:hypothetical protein